jgi:hypothetical protein
MIGQGENQTSARDRLRLKAARLIGVKCIWKGSQLLFPMVSSGDVIMRALYRYCSGSY